MRAPARALRAPGGRLRDHEADAQIERDRVAGGGEGTGRRRGKAQTGRLLRVGEKGSEHKKAALPA